VPLAGVDTLLSLSTSPLEAVKQTKNHIDLLNKEAEFINKVAVRPSLLGVDAKHTLSL